MLNFSFVFGDELRLKALAAGASAVDGRESDMVAECNGRIHRQRGLLCLPAEEKQNLGCLQNAAARRIGFSAA